MIIRLEQSRVPPFVQIRQQIADQVRSGVIPPGTRLPSIRQLAGELDLAANTVARAYRELEQSGLVATHGRNGTLVSDATSLTSREAELLLAAQRFLDEAAELGLDPEEARKGLQARVNMRVLADRGAARVGEQDSEGQLSADSATMIALRTALAVRVTLEQAVGVIAEEHGLDIDTARDALRHSARVQRVPVLMMARDVVERRGFTES